jgi:magnesium transporter
MTAPFVKKKAPSGSGRKSGLAPGSLIYVGKKKPREARITQIRYNPDGLEEKTIEAIEDCFPLNAQDSVFWINLD